jgi:hypothetical protein
MIEIGLVILLLALVLGGYLIVKSLKGFLVNALLGLIVLYLVNLVTGLGIAYTWIVILICALGGGAGAVIVIVLNILGIAF